MSSSDLMPEGAAPSCRRSVSWASFLVYLALVASLAATGATFLFSRSYSAPSARLPAVLEILPEHLNFGTSWTRSDFEWKLPVTNVSNEAVHVDLTTSCACTSLKPVHFDLQPGQSQDVGVVLNLNATNVSFETLRGRFDVAIIARIDQNRAAQSWTLRGEVRAALLVERSTFVFQDSLSFGSAHPTQNLKVFCPSDDCEYVSANCDPTKASVEINPIEGEPGWQIVSVTPATDLPIGEHEFPITLSCRYAGNVTPPAVSIGIVAVVEGDFRVTPRPGHLGLVEVGDLLEETLLLRSYNGRAFRVESIESTLDEVSVKVITDDHDGAECYETRLQVRCVPRTEGAKSATVVVHIASSSITQQSNDRAQLEFPLRFEAIAKPLKSFGGDVR